MSDWTRVVFGTRSRLYSVVGTLVALVLVVPIVLLVLGFVVPAALCVLVGLIGIAVSVMALLPGRRRWR